MKFLTFGCLFLTAAVVLSSAEEEKAEEKESELGTVIGIDLGTTYSW